jgi:hypothetical protein
MADLDDSTSATPLRCHSRAASAIQETVVAALIPSSFCKALQIASKRFETLQIALLQNASECCEMFRFDSFTPVHSPSRGGCFSPASTTASKAVAAPARNSSIATVGLPDFHGAR